MITVVNECANTVSTVTEIGRNTVNIFVVVFVKRYFNL